MSRSIHHTENATDVAGEVFVHFRVAGYGLFLTGGRIQVDVMPGSGAEQETASGGESPHELPALHTAISFSA